MKTDFELIDGVSIGVVTANGIGIQTTQDVIDLMADCVFNGANSMVFFEKDLPADFYDLKTGFAGEVLQKFSTYRVRLAIVGDFGKYTSNSLRSFILESNKHRHINFVSSIEEARVKLNKKFG